MCGSSPAYTTIAPLTRISCCCSSPTPCRRVGRRITDGYFEMAPRFGFAAFDAAHAAHRFLDLGIAVILDRARARNRCAQRLLDAQDDVADAAHGHRGVHRLELVGLHLACARDRKIRVRDGPREMGA